MNKKLKKRRCHHSRKRMRSKKKNKNKKRKKKFYQSQLEGAVELLQNLHFLPLLRKLNQRNQLHLQRKHQSPRRSFLNHLPRNLLHLDLPVVNVVNLNLKRQNRKNPNQNYLSTNHNMKRAPKKNQRVRASQFLNRNLRKNQKLLIKRLLRSVK